MPVSGLLRMTEPGMQYTATHRFYPDYRLRAGQEHPDTLDTIVRARDT